MRTMMQQGWKKNLTDLLPKWKETPQEEFTEYDLHGTYISTKNCKSTSNFL